MWQATPLSNSSTALAACFSPECLETTDVAEKTLPELVQEWKQGHLNVEKSMWTTPEPRRAVVTPCLQAGRCRCSLQGRGLTHIKAKLQQAVRNMIAHGHDNLRYVQDGFLLIEWIAQPPLSSSVSEAKVAKHVASKSSRDSAGLDRTPEPISTHMADKKASKHLFTHVSAFITRPWRATFVCMHIDEEDIARLDILTNNGDPGAQAFRFHCAVGDGEHLDIRNMWDFMDTLERDQRWSIRFWWASEAEAPTHRLNLLHARPSTMPVTLLWDGGQTPRRQRRPLHERMQRLIANPIARGARDIFSGEEMGQFGQNDDEPIDEAESYACPPARE